MVRAVLDCAEASPATNAAMRVKSVTARRGQIRIGAHCTIELPFTLPGSRFSVRVQVRFYVQVRSSRFGAGRGRCGVAGCGRLSDDAAGLGNRKPDQTVAGGSARHRDQPGLVEGAAHAGARAPRTLAVLR